MTSLWSIASALWIERWLLVWVCAPLWPIEQHEIVDVSEVRRAEPGPVCMLTGDTNLVDVDLIIQYRVSDPVAFQLGMADVQETPPAWCSP